MFWLILKSYWFLIRVEARMVGGAFPALCEQVRSYPVGQKTEHRDTLGRVCAALNTACIWYFKEVLCLQRAAATTCVLRGCGISAEMIIGAQCLPFRAHAWVEVDGQVVNDKPYVTEIYTPLERL
jgi:hypothetical protein